MLQGYMCPDSKKVSFSQCLSCNQDEKCLPKIFRLAILLNTQFRGPEITVTNLLNCLRKTYYEKTHDYWIEPAKAYNSFRGSIIHSILAELSQQEFKGEDELCGVINSFLGNLVVEKRYSKKVNGCFLSGAIDCYDKETKTLYDFKSYKAIEYLLREGCAKPEHVWQTNIYKWLLPYPVEKIKIVYITLGGVYVTGHQYDIIKKRKTGDIVEKYQLAEVELKSDEEIAQFIEPRIKILDAALNKGGSLPPVVEESGRWICQFCSFRSECESVK